MSVNAQLLSDSDLEYLNSRGLNFEVKAFGNEIHLIIKDFELPSHYAPRHCNLLLRLPPGYPNTNPDMFWTSPEVRLVNGGVPIAAQVVENLGGVSWQRWSRHNNVWRPGVDDIQTKIRAVRTELEKGR